MEIRDKLKEQDGSVLIVALIMLVLITLMGISATTTTDIEIQIAGNDIVHKQNLYLAESASMVAVQRMENTNDIDTLSWVNQAVDQYMEDKVRTESFWNDTNTASLDSNSRYVVFSEGTIDTGESLDMTRARIHSFGVFGRSTRNNGESIVRMGYRKAF
jgi:hypothetical protein